MKASSPDSRNNHYDRDYFESGNKRVVGPYTWESKSHYFEIILNTVLYLNPTRILDIGCAKGFLVWLFRQKGIEAYGLDISSYALENAPPAVGESLFVTDVEGERFPFSDSCFDLIIGLELLEHLSCFDSFLTECSRVLTKEGHLFFTTPAPGSWDATSDPYHVSVFLEEEWYALFRRHGFSPLEGREFAGFRRHFIDNYREHIARVPPERKIAKLLMSLGPIGRLLRSNLQVHVNFFSPWKTTYLLLLEKRA